MNRRALGKAYEEKAAAFLESRGYEILERNFSSPGGEIDLIARDGQYLVFVEVKYRRDEGSGNPLEAVTPAKQRVICRVASYYLYTHGYGEDMPCRFDVAAVLGKQVNLVRNAFEYQG